MPEASESLSMLADVLLASHTMVTKHGAGWIAQEITPTGRLAARRPYPVDPREQGWRGTPTR